MAEKFVADATAVVKFRLIRTEADTKNKALDFSPEFCHQFFGDHETIFGYEDLQITLLASFCNCYVYPKIKYKQMCSKKLCDLDPDDIVASLKKLYPDHAILTDYSKFLSAVEGQYTFTPFGELLHVYTTDTDNEKREFCIYKVDETSKCKEFVEFYERLETYAFWYIDAASCIDTKDNRWQFYLLYEKYMDSSKRTCYGFVGYSSVYLYYAYPEHLKPRIGHFLILPPFHRSGHGFRILQAIYNDHIPDPKVLEIVAEDPALNFVKLRDYVDCTNCMRLASCSPIEKLKISGFTKEFVEEARAKLKIGKIQARRVYEILRLKATDASNADEFKAYRLSVKRRLYKPYKKNSKDWKNLSKALTAEEAASTAASMTRENIHLALQSAFEQTMDEYRPVLDRLATLNKLPEVVLAKKAPKKDDSTTNGFSA